MNTTCNTGNGIREMHGRKMRDSDWRKGGNGVLTVPEIIKKSSNVGVSTLIDNAYASNPDQFVSGLQRIGIMEDLHIPIPGYKNLAFAIVETTPIAGMAPPCLDEHRI